MPKQSLLDNVTKHVHRERKEGQTGKNRSASLRSYLEEAKQREAESRLRAYAQQRSYSQFQAERNAEIADWIKSMSPMEVADQAQQRRGESAQKTGNSILTPEIEAEYQRRSGRGNGLTPYQTYMQTQAAKVPAAPVPETKSTDELRKDMNRQNRIAAGTERMAADMSRDIQNRMFDPAYTTNLQTIQRQAEVSRSGADRATEHYQTLSTQRRMDEEQAKVADLMKNPDFQKNSQGSQAVADGGMVTATGSNSTARLYRDIYYRRTAGLNGKGSTDSAGRNVTDDEAAVFFYLWNTQGAKAAEAYYKDYVENRAGQRQMETIRGRARAYGEYDPIGASVRSVGTNLMSGVGLVDMAWQNLARSVGFTDKDKPLNYYSPAQSFSMKTDAYRQGASDFLEQAAADELRRDFPSLKNPEKFAKVASFLYQTGMSMADSSVAVALNLMGVPEPLTLANMGAAAGTRAMREAKERGATDGQALAFGFSSAIMEALFEKVSLDRILSETNSFNLAQSVFETLKQGFTEGSEEVMTTLANTAADQLVMGDKSELFTIQRQLMEQGVSEKEARREALMQRGTGIIGDAICGFLSGVGMGGVKEYTSARNNPLWQRNMPMDVAGGLRHGALTAQETRTILNERQTMRKPLESGVFGNNSPNTAEKGQARQTSDAMTGREIALTPIDDRGILKENIVSSNRIGNLEGDPFEYGKLKGVGFIAQRANKNGPKLPSSEGNANAPVSQVGKQYGLTYDEEAAVLDYKSSYSYLINAKLRAVDEAMQSGETDPLSVLDKKDHRFLENMDRALRKLPVYDGTVYRNLSFDDFGGEKEYRSFLEKHNIGSVVGYPAYTSSSKSRSGHPIEGDYVANLVIQNKSGRELAGFGNNTEKEVLAPRNTVFYIEDIKYESGIPTIYLQEVAYEQPETDANSGGVAAVQPVQTSGTENGDMQSVSGRNPKGLIVQSQGPSEPVSGGSRNPVRGEGLRIPFSEEFPTAEPNPFAPNAEEKSRGTIYQAYLALFDLKARARWRMAAAIPKNTAYMRYLRQYNEKQRETAMWTTQILGYVPEEFAKLLGEEPGTAYGVVVANQRNRRSNGSAEESDYDEYDNAYGVDGVDDAGEYDIINTAGSSELPLASHNMHNSSDSLYERSKHVPSYPGYDDVFIHGNAWGVATKDADGKVIDIPNDEFIEVLKSLELENGAIRLCACNAGADDDGIASYVSKKLDLRVMAPTTCVWIGFPDNDGISEMELFEDDGRGHKAMDRPGHWRLFWPDGRIEDLEL